MTAASAVQPNPLTRRQRAWIALYSLTEPTPDRLEILRLNEVTEADLREHELSWRRLCERPPVPHYLMPRLPASKPE